MYGHFKANPALTPHKQSRREGRNITAQLTETAQTLIIKTGC